MTAETFAEAYPARFATATMPARRRSRCVLFRLFCTIVFTAWSPPARRGRRTVSELTARRPRRTGHQALLARPRPGPPLPSSRPSAYGQTAALVFIAERSPVLVAV